MTRPQEKERLGDVNTREPFFIVGSQRSGTTLLRLILNSHSHVAIPEEGVFWMPLIRLHSKEVERPISKARLARYLGYISKNAQFKLWGMDPRPPAAYLQGLSREISLGELMDAFYQEYMTREGKRIWGEKSPVFSRKIPEIRKIFPRARFIHVVRDGRDVFLSWRKLLASRRNPGVAALEWRYKTGKIQKAFEGLPEESHCTIRYEDLVASPEDTARRICGFLGVEFQEKMMEFWKSSSRYIGSHHSELIFKPVSTISAGKWETAMSPFENKVFEFLAGRRLQQFGYRCMVESRGFGMSDRLKIFFLLLIGLPWRSFQVLSTVVRLWLAARLGVKTKAAGSGEAPVNQRIGADRESR